MAELDDDDKQLEEHIQDKVAYSMCIWPNCMLAGST
jgi:hypothetical protein